MKGIVSRINYNYFADVRSGDVFKCKITRSTIQMKRALTKILLKIVHSTIQLQSFLSIKNQQQQNQRQRCNKSEDFQSSWQSWDISEYRGLPVTNLSRKPRVRQKFQEQPNSSNRITFLVETAAKKSYCEHALWRVHDGLSTIAWINDSV